MGYDPYYNCFWEKIMKGFDERYPLKDDLRIIEVKR